MRHKSGRVGAIAAVVIAGALAVAGVAASGEPNPPQPNPAEPVDYVKWYNDTYGVGIKQNAADEYIKAFELYEAIEKAHGGWRRDDADWKAAYAGPWSDNPELEAWLKAARPALAAYERATLITECYLASRHPAPADPNTPEDLVQRRVREALYACQQHMWAPFRRLSEARLALGWRAFAQGDHDELIRAICAVTRAGRHSLNQHSLIERLVGVVCIRMACEATLSGAAKSGDAPAFAVKVLSECDELDQAARPFSHVIVWERLGTLDVAQRMYVRKRESGRYWLDFEMTRAFDRFVSDDEPAEFELGAVFAVGMLYMHDFKSTESAISACYTEVERFADLPFRESFVPLARFQERIRVEGHILLRILMPSFQRALVMETRGGSQRRGTRLVLHVLAHRHEAGEYPARLVDVSALKADKKLRTDPFSDEEFVYRKTADGFTLYSVGMDFDDDGGKHDPKWGESDGGGDFVFWPVPGDE